jgi:mannose-1-phosphate guanylyltransferase/mannose-6-phosphate isomerase
MGQTIYPVILSGGSGSRLWPVSRASYPKQFLPLASGKPMIIATAERVLGDGFAPPTIVCNHECRFIVAESFQSAGIDPLQIVLEPFGRNTASAAAVAALSVAERDLDGVLLLMPSDHLIASPDEFRHAVSVGREAAERGLLVTFGVTPSGPHTGYGYIERGAPIADCDGVDAIRRFVEKPSPELAVELAASGAHCWNAGIFLFRAGALIEEMARHAPDVLEAARSALERAATDLDFLRLDAESFAAAPSVPLDIAVMEKTARGAVVPVEMNWSDIGSWHALWEASDRDGDGNSVAGDVLLADTRGTLVRSEGGTLTAVVGVDDLVVVATDDAVLVASRDRAEDVKGLVAEMERLGRTEHLHRSTVYRPWGSYQSLDGGDGYLVKRINVKPGGCLSLQYHHHRAEHWVVVEGEATITRGSETFVLGPNQSTYIPMREVHRLDNRGTGPLILIEVQTGELLSEDDITRLEDMYGRS